MTDFETIAQELLETDALTASDGETLHPDHYIVAAANVPYLVENVLGIAARMAEADSLMEDIEQVHVLYSDGVCRISLNGQGHLPCDEHTRARRDLSGF